MPRGDAVRPTADRVRESLFGHLRVPTQARVLDLFAGSGALGIEALSRGAGEAWFVEQAASVLVTLRSNLAALALEPRCRVQRGSAERWVERLGRAGERFDLIFADPPYGPAAGPGVLAAVARADLLAPGGTLVIETDRRHPPGHAARLVESDARRYGDTLLTCYQRAAASAGRGGEDPSHE